MDAERKPFAMTGLDDKWTAEEIKALRERYRERQEQFCQRLGVGIDALRYWEQGRGTPNGSAKILLTILEQQLNESAPTNGKRKQTA